jgi:hypothetical protein
MAAVGSRHARPERLRVSRVIAAAPSICVSAPTNRRHASPTRQSCRSRALEAGGDGCERDRCRPHLGGIRANWRSGRESFQVLRRIPPRSRNETIPAQFGSRASDRVGARYPLPLLERLPAEPAQQESHRAPTGALSPTSPHAAATVTQTRSVGATCGPLRSRAGGSGGCAPRTAPRRSAPAGRPRRCGRPRGSTRGR